MIETVTATRYVAPLREGGSLPGLVEADDLGLYVTKFRGAGQGPAVLFAEVIVGELARRLGLRTPRLVAVEVNEAIARYEADEEVQDLLTKSLGLNLGIDFLPGSLGFNATTPVDDETAAGVLWLDAYVANVDRTWRNPNLLVWHRDLWLIDHGAALYFHHGWSGRLDPDAFARQPWDATGHVFADRLDALPEVDSRLAPMVTPDLLDDVLADVPDQWLAAVPGQLSPTEARAGYRAYLLARVAHRTAWLPGAAVPR